MDIFRTGSPVALVSAEKFDGADWLKLARVEVSGGLILSNLTDHEHDSIMNIRDFGDPDGLRGIMATLHVENNDKQDPQIVNLISIPERMTIVRHQDRYYQIIQVIQSTNISVALLVRKVNLSDVWRSPV